MIIRRIFVALILLVLLCGNNIVLASENPAGFEPQFDLIIRPVSFWRPTFAVKGTVTVPGHIDQVNVAEIPWQKFVFKVAGVEQKLDGKGLIRRPTPTPDPWQVAFEGLSRLHAPKSMATGDEIYCLNNFPPNPELLTDKPSRYNVKFDLPVGYSAISFDQTLSSSMGLQFQIARFQKAMVRTTANFTFEYIFPEGFSAEPAYLEFLETTMEKWFALFGDPGFNVVRIGVIRRGEAKGEINGSPCGNLILLSRSALGGKVDLSGLATMGITSSDADQFRKMVIAHELSHFWFGVKFTGKDGWMTEGIPQYLGMYAVYCENTDKIKPLLTFSEYLDKMIPQDAIPNHPFSDDQVLYIKAYYQGSLALFKIGETIGHEKLLSLLMKVFTANSNPEFADFDKQFSLSYPDQHDSWLKAWRIK